jgi:catechol 2,3-dioxygenase-like lactoylglutathione lyase family enzyme
VADLPPIYQPETSGEMAKGMEVKVTDTGRAQGREPGMSVPVARVERFSGISAEDERCRPRLLGVQSELPREEDLLRGREEWHQPCSGFRLSSLPDLTAVVRRGDVHNPAQAGLTGSAGATGLREATSPSSVTAGLESQRSPEGHRAKHDDKPGTPTGLRGGERASDTQAVNFTHAFAGVAVSDYPLAYEWYVRLFGREADMYPHDHEAVWRLTTNSSVYVVGDAERAGNGLLTLATDDLAGLANRLEAEGLAFTRDADRDAPESLTVNDEDGNRTKFFQDPKGPWSSPAMATPPSTRSQPSR